MFPPVHRRMWSIQAAFLRPRNISPSIVAGRCCRFFFSSDTTLIVDVCSAPRDPCFPVYQSFPVGLSIHWVSILFSLFEASCAMTCAELNCVTRERHGTERNRAGIDSCDTLHYSDRKTCGWTPTADLHATIGSMSDAMSLLASVVRWCCVIIVCSGPETYFEVFEILLLLFWFWWYIMSGPLTVNHSATASYSHFRNPVTKWRRWLKSICPVLLWVPMAHIQWCGGCRRRYCCCCCTRVTSIAGMAPTFLHLFSLAPRSCHRHPPQSRHVPGIVSVCFWGVVFVLSHQRSFIV